MDKIKLGLNGENIADPTAGQALAHVRYQEKRKDAVEVLKKMRAVAEAEGWYFHGDLLVLTEAKSRIYAKFRNF